MFKIKKKFFTVIVISAIFMLSGCVEKVQHGYVFDDNIENKMSNIEIGSTTIADLQYLLGSPTFEDISNVYNAFYMSQSGIRITLIGDIIWKRQIIRYIFNNKTLIDIKSYSIKNSQKTSMKKIDIKIKNPNSFFTLPLYKII